MPRRPSSVWALSPLNCPLMHRPATRCLACALALSLVNTNTGACAQSQVGLTLRPSQPITLYGGEIAISGDLLAVGATGNYTAATAAGAVHTYRWDGATWVITDLLLGRTPTAQTGGEVEIDGNRLAFGARYDDTYGTRAGSVSVYDFDGSSWQPTGLPIAGLAAYDNLGDALSLDGDRLAIASPRRQRAGASGDGAVTVYAYDGASWAPLGQTIFPSHSVGAFGHAVELKGDHLAISTLETNVDRPSTVVLYEYDRGVWNQIGDTLLSPVADARFGAEVQIEGDILVIGSSPSTREAPYSGEVYSYRWDGGAWMPLGPTIGPLDTEHYVGEVFALGDGALAVTNEPRDFEGMSIVQLYKIGSAGWELSGDPIRGRASGDRFGSALDLDGTRLAVGVGRAHFRNELYGEALVFDVTSFVSGVSDRSFAQSLALFPNPTADIVNFSRSEISSTPTYYRVFSPQGGCLLQGRLDFGKSEIVLFGLPPGTYLVTIFDNKDTPLAQGKILKR